MPTVFSHPAVALATIPVLKNSKRKPLVVLSGMILTILPDLDVLAFKVGIPYNHVFGHRGFSHSILFAFIASGLFTLMNKQLSWSKNLFVWIYFFICALSHSLLDAMTNGGLGVGLFIPFSVKRFFFEFRPIQVSTLNIQKFFNGQGGSVLQNEAFFIWIPALCLLVSVYSLFKIMTSVYRRMLRL